MASSVGICNRALDKLGAPGTIINLTDDTVNASVMLRAYDIVRQAELRRHRWKFSLSRASLAELSTPPISGFGHQYQQPADCLRVIQIGELHVGADLSDYVNSSTEMYSIEGRKILTHYGAPLPIRYIIDVTDTGLFDSAFTEALSSRLAYECCERITQSDSKRQLAMADYKLAIREAARANALESAPQKIADDTWVLARTSS